MESRTEYATTEIVTRVNATERSESILSASDIALDFVVGIINQR